MSLDRLVGIFGLIFVATIVLRLYVVHRKCGQVPILLNGADTVHDFLHKSLFGIVILAAANIVLFRLQAIPDSWSIAPLNGLYEYLCPISWLQSREIQIVGLVLAYGGLGLAAVAQSQMGRDWRIGHDARHETAFVDKGLFQLSRHPIYLGFMAVTVGLFLATPNALSLVCAALAIIVLSVTARLEEAFMASLHGDAYRDYLSNTRRWI